MYWLIIPSLAHGCSLLLFKHLLDVFSCISLRSNSVFLPVYCWPCNFVYDVFVASGFSYTLYSDSGSPSPFLFMVITRERFILALGECLLCFFVRACVLKLESVFFEVKAFVKWSEKFVKPQLSLNFVSYRITYLLSLFSVLSVSSSTLRMKLFHYMLVCGVEKVFLRATLIIWECYGQKGEQWGSSVSLSMYSRGSLVWKQKWI